MAYLYKGQRCFLKIHWSTGRCANNGHNIFSPHCCKQHRLRRYRAPVERNRHIRMVLWVKSLHTAFFLDNAFFRFIKYSTVSSLSNSALLREWLMNHGTVSSIVSTHWMLACVIMSTCFSKDRTVLWQPCSRNTEIVFFILQKTKQNNGNAPHP